MPRNYTEVLEDTCKNQMLQIASLVAENEQIKEYNRLLGEKINAASNSSPLTGQHMSSESPFAKAVSTKEDAGA